MPTDVVMPQMGESIFEGTITKWLKKAGETVEKDEPLFEISTDKVDAEIPSPVAGILGEIKVPEGSTVSINTVVASITQPSEAAEEARAHEAADGSAEPAPAALPKTTTPSTSAMPVSGPQTAVDAASESGRGPIVGGTEVVMPQMGESIFEGTITRWLKKVGDVVEKDEPLFEISTDKVDAEIPSPVSGVLSSIKALEGETVGINAVVAVIGGAGQELIGLNPGSSIPILSDTPPTTAAVAVEATATEAAAESVAEAGHEAKLRSSPLVRRMARENNLDLRGIAGSGSAGRITKDDMLGFLNRHGGGSAAASARAKPQPASRASASPVPASPASAGPAAAKAAVSMVTPAASTLPGTVVPLSRMRAIIAERMLESKRISPHVYSVYKVDMTRVVRLRERERSHFEQKHGVKLTFMPFIAVAAIEALRQHPIVNSSLKDAAIHYHANIDLGLAVALEWGLIVPVVKQAEKMSFVDLARVMADLAERARAKKLKPEEASGSTFTLTNSGVFGGEFGTPIINQPESAILAIGGLKKEPVVMTDADGGDTIAIRSMQSYCLGFDHRIIDGADAGKFMSLFKKVLEGWDSEIG